MLTKLWLWVQRVVAHGTHRIRDSIVAVDVAVPEEPGNLSHRHDDHFRFASEVDQSVRIDCSQGLRNNHSRDLSQMQSDPHRPY